MIYLLIAIGASFGALLRFGIFQLISPLWALLLVNAVGSFLAGVVAARAGQDSLLPFLVVVGFCGALTTFSAYSLELVYLMKEGFFFKTACHFFLNNALCLLLCYIGYTKLSWI